MAMGAREARICRAGASVSLTAALIMGGALSVAQPSLATEQGMATEQVAEDASPEPVAEPVEEPAEAPADELPEVPEEPDEEPSPLEEEPEELSEDPSEETVEEVDEQADEQIESDETTSEDPAPTLELLATAEPSTTYDTRTTEGTSAIRDQFWGTCWAQSGISTVESFLIHSGQESTGVQFSVEDMLWWTYQSNWYLPFRESSGSPTMATGYLTTVGVRSEADIPYLGKPADYDDEMDNRMGHPSNLYENGENQRPANYDIAPVQYEVTDMVYVRNPSPQEVKDLITQYGAVSTNMKMSEDYFDPARSTDWGNDRYDESGEEMYESNHAVSVVGWIDSFPKEWFVEQNGKRPEHDGAWIIKNSLGTGYGSDGGFTYVSYDDEFLFKADSNPNLSFSYAVAGARKPLEQKRYLHDTYGAVATWQPEGSTSFTWANVFDFGSGEKLNELSFVTWAKGDYYELYYAPMSDGVPSADEGEWVSLAQGTIEHAGYHTVSAGWDGEVPAGKGAIVLRVTGAAPSIGTEEYLTDVRGKPLFVLARESAQGKGYMLQDGAFVEASIQRGTEDRPAVEWPILCIRAYTVPSDGVEPGPGPVPVEPEPVGPAAPDEPVAPSTPKHESVPAARAATAERIPETGDKSSAMMVILALLGSLLTAAGALISPRRES